MTRYFLDPVTLPPMPEIADQRQTTNDKQQTNLLALRLLFPAIALGLGWAIQGAFWT